MKEKNPTTKIARIIGVLTITCTAATIISIPFSNPFLSGPDYLIKIAENKTSILFGTIFEFIWAITCAGIAIGLYPILKKYNRFLALGSVSFRIVEGVFVLIGTLSLLSLLTLSQEYVSVVAPVASSFQTSGTLLIAVRDWAHNVILLLAFNLGAFLYYYLLYQSRLIPIWLSGWGILGNVMSLIAIFYYVSTNDLGTIHTLLNAPIAIQEMVFALWLIIKGFSPSKIIAESPRKS